jgi:hypothetical protein
MKKTLVIFATTSMLATGVSLASNISIGQKMAAFLSNTFEFVGPMSGLVYALVKPASENVAPVIPNFQDGISGQQGVQARLVLPSRFPERVAFSATPGSAMNVQALSDINSRAMSTGRRDDDALGSVVAKAITENGDRALLANLGNNLQGKFKDVANPGATLEMWANLINKPGLEPIKVALLEDRQNKQVEAGSRIAQTVNPQGLSQTASANAAAILAQSSDAAGGNAAVGNGQSVVATQITAGALAQAVSDPSNAPGKVPVPGGLALVLVGLCLGAARKLSGSKQSL